MSIRQDSRNKSWYYRFKYKGRSYYQGGFLKFNQAKKAETKRLNKAIEAKHCPDEIPELSFAEAGKLFFENHALKNKRSWRNDKARVGLLIQYFGEKKLSDITSDNIETFLIWLCKHRKGRSGGPLTDHTRNHYLVMIKIVFNYLKKRRLFQGDNPANYVEMKKIPRARVRFLYPEEEKILSPEVLRDPTVWTSYYVALHTGMRAGEIAKMRVKDISSVTRTIFIPNSKNSRSRHVPISDNLIIFLMKQIKGKKPDDYVLSGFIRDYISRRFKNICHQVGIVDFMFHDLRHTFTQRLLAKGVPIYKVSKILGHSSVVVTEQHYGHLSNADLREEIDKIDGVVKVGVAAKLQQEVMQTVPKLSNIVDDQHIGGVA